MNATLYNTMIKNTPQFNKDVTNGTSTKILKEALLFLDDNIRESIKSISPNINFKYHGYRKLTPKEEFDKMFTNNKNKVNYDLSISDMYMVELLFSYNEEKISRYIYLPFSSEGNIMHISNTKYNIVPVLSDTVISPSHKEVFVRLLKDKLIFRGNTRNFIFNGERVPGEIIHSNIVKVNETQITDNIGKPLASTSLYLLGMYGFRETLSRYIKTDNYIVTDKDTISYIDDYNIYESTKIKPRGLKEYGYVGHDIKICIHKSITITTFLENFIYGIIYVLDMFPESANDFIGVLSTANVRQEKLLWRILLGRISYKNSYSVDRIAADINEHFDVLQGYMDNLIKSKLAENNIYVENFFDLLVVIMDNFNIWLLNSKEYNGNINNRYIDIMYYIFYDIIVGFNKVVLNINKRANKKLLTATEIQKLFHSELSTRSIYSLVKSKAVNLCMMVAESTSDIMYPKLTALLEDQSRGNGVRRGTKTQFPESTKTIKGYDLYLGSLLFLTKTAPSPRFRTNLFLKYNVKTGRLIIPEDIVKTVSKLDLLLQGRINSNKITLLDSGDDQHNSEDIDTDDDLVLDADSGTEIEEYDLD